MKIILTLLAASAFAADAPVLKPIPLELSSDFFAADSAVLRVQAQIPAEVQTALNAAGKAKEAALAALRKFCGDKASPGVDPKNASRLVCIDNPSTENK